MKPQIFTLFFALMTLSFSNNASSAKEPSVKASVVKASFVRVEKTVQKDGKNVWRLLRDGKPYFVKGACVWGDDERKIYARLDELAQAGANSVRTYWHGDAQSTLDRAAKLKMTVTLGLDVDKPRHGFDFNDEKTILAQEKRITEQVEKYKNHPALLMWGIGNEVELMLTPAQNERVYQVLNRLAKLVRVLDPHHPTIIVLAGIDEQKAAQVMRFCPDVDIVGINIYGALIGLPARLNEWKFERPTVITEWGNTGYWEIAHTSWNAPIEENSSQKAALFERAYTSGIAGDARRCLGSYAFIWSQKQEVTATWFGLFLASGERVNAQDVLQKIWTKRAPKTLCPTISPIAMTGEKFAPQSVIAVSVRTSSTRKTRIEWLLARESDDRKIGGDAEHAPAFFSDGIRDLGQGKAEITLPKSAGAYRVFVFVRDDKNNAATANAPFLVEAL